MAQGRSWKETAELRLKSWTVTTSISFMWRDACRSSAFWVSCSSGKVTISAANLNTVLANLLIRVMEWAHPVSSHTALLHPLISWGDLWRFRRNWQCDGVFWNEGVWVRWPIWVGSLLKGVQCDHVMVVCSFRTISEHNGGLRSSIYNDEFRVFW